MSNDSSFTHEQNVAMTEVLLFQLYISE